MQQIGNYVDQDMCRALPKRSGNIFRHISEGVYGGGSLQLQERFSNFRADYLYYQMLVAVGKRLHKYRGRS